jgi:hypothetical protein
MSDTTTFPPRLQLREADDLLAVARAVGLREPTGVVSVTYMRAPGSAAPADAVPTTSRPWRSTVRFLAGLLAVCAALAALYAIPALLGARPL